jgi:hypothetical protein
MVFTFTTLLFVSPRSSRDLIFAVLTLTCSFLCHFFHPYLPWMWPRSWRHLPGHFSLSVSFGCKNQVIRHVVTILRQLTCFGTTVLVASVITVGFVLFVVLWDKIMSLVGKVEQWIIPSKSSADEQKTVPRSNER